MKAVRRKLERDFRARERAASQIDDLIASHLGFPSAFDDLRSSLTENTMPFPFREVCDLLESLEKVESKGHGDGDTPKYKRIKEAVNKEISEWFNKHQTTIDALEDAGTLLSMLWPEKRMDRCMSIPCQRSGTHIIAVLGLGRRGDELSTKTYDNFAFSEMVGKIMAAAENPLPSPGNEVTVEEVDDAFNFLSIKCHPHPMGSGVKRVEPVMSWGGEYDVFRKLFKRFSSVEGKWFLRLLKRDIFPVAVPCESSPTYFQRLLTFVQSRIPFQESTFSFQPSTISAKTFQYAAKR